MNINDFNLRFNAPYATGVLSGQGSSTSLPGSGGALSGGGGYSLSSFLDPQVALPIAAQLIGGRNLQQSLAGGFAAAGPALEDQKRRAALNAWLKAKSGQGLSPEDAQLIQYYPDLAAKIVTNSVGLGTPAEVRNDPNGVPRFVNGPKAGQEVFPGVQQHGVQGIFAGKSVQAQGLNWLIANGKITEEQASELASSKPVTGPDGTTYLMTPQGIFGQAPGEQAQPIDPATADTEGATAGEVAPQVASVPAGAIPLSGPKSFGGDEQTKAAGFARRVAEASRILAKPDIAAAGQSLIQKGESKVPVVGNFLVSSEFQQYDQASRDLINAILRRESGAAISESEFENARKQYLPQPGDSDKVLQQKARNRQSAFENLQRSAGPLNQGFAATPPGGAAPKETGWTDLGNGVRIRVKPQ